MVKNFSEGLPNVENPFSFPVGIMWKTFRRQTAADKPPPLISRRRHAAAANKAVKNQELSAQKGYSFSLTSKQNKLSDIRGLP